jgi:hypothetical protein
MQLRRPPLAPSAVWTIWSKIPTARTQARRRVFFPWDDESDLSDDKSGCISDRKCFSELQGGDVTYHSALLRRVYDADMHVG